MFNALFQACKGFFHFNNCLSDVAILIANIETKYVQDQNAKDAAIDAVCEILQAHKSTASKVP